MERKNGRWLSLVSVPTGLLVSALLCYAFYSGHPASLAVVLFSFLLLFVSLVALAAGAAQFWRQRGSLAAGSWVLVVAFLALVFASGFPLVPDPEGEVPQENRLYNQRPVFSPAEVEAYPAAFEGYINDAFPARDLMRRGYGLYKSLALHDSASPLMIRGGEGWQFLETTLPDYKTHASYSEEELRLILGFFQGLNNYVEERGAKLYVTFAPNKAEIYPEKMPARVRAGAANRFDQLEDYLNTNGDFSYIPLRETLVEAKAAYPELYYPMGSHWNNIGAYLACNRILAALAADYPGVQTIGQDDLSWTDYQKPQALEDRWAFKDISFTLAQTVMPARSCEIIDLPAWGTPDVWETKTLGQDAGAAPYSVKFIRDSFGTNLLPFFGPQFAEATYYWGLALHPESYDRMEVRPGEIVLFELVERNIWQILALQRGEPLDL